MRVKVIASLICTSAIGGSIAHGQTLSEGYNPSVPLNSKVQFRNMASGGGKEIVVSRILPSVLTAEGDVTYGTSQSISFSYSPVTGELRASVGGVIVIRTGVGNLGTLNYAVITIKSGASASTVTINGLTLGGQPITGGQSLGVPSAGTKQWNLTGVSLTDGFTLGGTLVLTGSQPGGDANYAEIAVGYDATSIDSTAPIISNLTVSHPVFLFGSATIGAQVDDSATGNSNIASAAYKLNAGAETAMVASDGAFNSSVENVNATLTNLAQIGKNTVCVSGTDAKSNVGVKFEDGRLACADFLVTYVFSGFFQPIDMAMINEAKAGQTVPAKWRLTDANGAPISSAASFQGMFSQPVDCATLGVVGDAIEEYGPGSSGLQYNGDGYWQYNWKTLKEYAGTCRSFYVAFDSETTSPVVVFKFKK